LELTGKKNSLDGRTNSNTFKNETTNSEKMVNAQGCFEDYFYCTTKVHFSN